MKTKPNKKQAKHKSVEPMVRRRLYDQASGITYPPVVPGKTNCFLILDKDLPRIVEAFAERIRYHELESLPFGELNEFTKDRYRRDARHMLRAIGMEVGS